MRKGLHSLANKRETAKQPVLSVSALSRNIKELLESNFSRVIVEGEITGFRPAASGHVYFSLKDSHALIDAVLWRSSFARLAFKPKDGDLVTAQGEISLYEPRGRYQLVITAMKPAGQGDLQQKFLELKAKLAEEGLFAYERKKALPERPVSVGIVTSRSGAALRDMLKIFRRRSPGLKIIVSPCLVQGNEAARDIIRALDRLERFAGVDIIVVARGGGSIEDLWPFNEEALARRLAACSLPVVSAVGHETDVTISDLVADVRAATPSEAAELIAPDSLLAKKQLIRLNQRLLSGFLQNIREARLRLSAIAGKRCLQKPYDMISSRWQAFDYTGNLLEQAALKTIDKAKYRQSLLAGKLSALSPLGILARGYAVVEKPDRTIIKNHYDVSPGEPINIMVNNGRVAAVVKNTSAD